MSLTTLLVVVLILLTLLLLVGGWSVLIANRLNRLHVRTDAGWAALESALARRAVVTRAVAAVGPVAAVAEPPRGPAPADRPPGASGADPGQRDVSAPGAEPPRVSPLDAERLRAAALDAELTPRPGREHSENLLGRMLGELDRSRLPVPLAAELTEAEERVMLARRVYNDAVRDTLALRSRRPVRWLRLAGGAPPPTYFEIVERAGEPEPATPVIYRPSARVLLLDAADRLLLFESLDPGRPQETFWCTAGGGVESGEELRAAAIREVAEETGLALAESDLVGPVWLRRAVFGFDGQVFDSEEWFFVARTDAEDVDVSGFTDLERRTVRGHRWWTAAELRETEATVYPVQLAEFLPDVIVGRWDGRVRGIR
ncbi:8-oxo-dGTP pyrophosphatase MutT (NUDIX family) [Actinoalloteichus hoggarensis]|uniref:Dihydroneopterin triphosphate pyrophosphatase n=1 Tax=Actinoalloteichus hoggarensis TaxID=1470176 RepID=A0A221W1P2_9PSEU|nr:NUDIX domain-containing protein [Actinoalloteichus hoggarensis]ASO19666.1 dihydroneopterin triphosphate pyrophosphatase [Actinoalloteichus hoggarensis]MBB5919627.1 8-oxo-dGTP pyrophosphatase MutT (NUDIX family) [Actinoalloteichus hoggarensis]